MVSITTDTQEQRISGLTSSNVLLTDQ